MKFQLVKISTHQSMVPGAQQEAWVMSAVPEKNDLAEFGHMLAPKALLPGKFYTANMTRWLASVYPEDAEWVSYWMNLTDSIESMQRHDRMSHNDEGYVRPKFITGEPATVSEIMQNLTGEPPEPDGTTREPEETQKEETKENPAEEPGEDALPDTMAGIWKLLGFTGESYYDFGIHTISPPGHRPRLEAAIKAYRKNMLLAVARALLLKGHGRKFTAEQVRKSAISAWKGNGRIKKYSEVIQANQSPETLRRLKGIMGEIPGFIEGRIDARHKYISKYDGEVWSLKPFVLWCKVGQKIEFKKTGWRTSGKG